MSVATMPPKFRNAQKNYQAPRNPPTQYELYTGGKVAYPEFTIFYNIAFFRVAGVINHFLGKPYKEDKRALETEFTDWLKKAKTASDDKVFTGLHNYLWKGFQLTKNPSANYVTEADKDLIIQFLTKLEVIRNFHSHYYHDNSVLAFSNDLKKQILNFHDDAQLAFTGKYIEEFALYDATVKERPFFKQHDNQSYITADGKTFFLSFFLTRSEMARFLQQRKGYKRTDTDEFKIKHLIYCYYTHRDGAARQHYGHTDNVLSTLSAIDQKDILNARQAYKLISYLNDVPPVCFDTDLFPLFLDDKPVESPFDFIHFCQKNSFFTEGVALMPLIKYDDENEDDFIVKDNFVVFEIAGYKVQVTKHTLHKLILDAIRLGDKGAATVAQLHVFVQEREDFYQLATDSDYLAAQYDRDKFVLNDELKEYHRYKLRNKYLQEKMGDWLEKIEKKKELKREKFIDKIKTAAIEVKYYDFYFGKDEKPRPTDLFTRFAVKYLIDFQKVPDWQWLFEKYEMVEKTKKIVEYGKPIVKKVIVNERVTFYSNVFPERKGQDTEGGDADTSTEPRLAMTDDGQIVVGIYTDTCDRTKPPVFKFLLGHRAIKNLLIAESEKHDIQSFFTPIIADIQMIRNNHGQTLGIDKLTILQENELPQSFKSAMKVLQFDNATLRAKAKNRIENIIREIEPLTDKEREVPLSRADKNRQIMRCYKYFNWVYAPDSEYKFLRQDEYQRMSVYHYCLDKRKNRDLLQGDFSFLIRDALPHTPENIKRLLRKSNDIDDLLANIATETIELFENWSRSLPALKGKALQEILGKLGIASYRNSPPLQDFIPFDIHPILVLRHFYPEKLTAKFTSLSRNLWINPINRKGLIQTHYNYESYFKNMNVPSDDEKKVKKHIIGAMNELKTQDILLWRMAKDYLKATSSAYQTFLQWEQKEENWQVGNLRNTEFKMPFFEIEINGRKLNKVFLSIKFHQMDDYLLVESDKVIKSAIKQVLMRFEDTNQTKTIQYEITKDAKGFYHLPYQEVFKEIQRVYNDSLHWARYILDWERNVVDAMTPQQITQFEQDKIAIGYSIHINFEDVCSTQTLSADMLEKLKSKLRNKTFHAEIPDGWAYWQMENDAVYADLRQLLGYQPKIKFDYENRKSVNSEPL